MGTDEQIEKFESGFVSIANYLDENSISSYEIYSNSSIKNINERLNILGIEEVRIHEDSTAWFIRHISLGTIEGIIYDFSKDGEKIKPFSTKKMLIDKIRNRWYYYGYTRFGYVIDKRKK